MVSDKKIKKAEPKLLFEREYIVPLRSEWLKVGKHKRANRAMKALKQFLVRHMKIYDRDLRKIKIDEALNNEMRFRGMRKPLAKVKVLAKKYDNDIVRVELVNVPDHVKFARLREAKKSADVKKKVEEKVEEKKEEVKEGDKKAEETKEKEQASKEAGLELAKEEAKEQKHTTNIKESKMKDIFNKRAQRGR